MDQWSAVSGQLHGGMHLVADVDGDEHSGEGLDGRGLGETAGVDTRAVRRCGRPAPPWPTVASA